MLLLSGQTAISEVLEKRSDRVEKLSLYAREAAPNLVSLAESQGLKVEVVEKANERGSSNKFDLGREHRSDVNLVLKPYRHPSMESLAARAKESGRPILILDQIQDPQNLGALFRLAAGAGLPGIVLTKKNCAAVSDTVRRVSIGGTEFVEHSPVANLQRAIKELQSAGIWVYGSSLEAGTQNFYEVDFGGSYALVLGSEGSGIRSLTAKSCDQLVSIPMPGQIQSLNVSQAASVLIFECLRRESS